MNTPDPAFLQALKQLILEAADKTEPAAKDPPASTTPPLAQRVASFKVLVDDADTTVKALRLKADNAKLWKDVDAGDPDEVGTTSELEAYVADRCREIEDAERAKGGA